MIEHHYRSLKRSLMCLAFILVVSNVSDRCRAEFVYTLGFGQSLYAGATGNEIQVDFYIRELVTDGSVARFAFGNNDGLFSVGATITYSSDFGIPATVASLSDVSFTSAFDGLEVVLTPMENRLEITSFLSSTNSPYLETNADVGNPNSYSILIGTVKFRVGDTPGNNTTISITNRELPGVGALDNNLAIESSLGFLELVNIDSSIRGSSANILHVTAVPEPGTIWLTLTAAALGGCRLRSKRNRAATHFSTGHDGC